MSHRLPHDDTAVTIDEMIAEARRELEQRHRTYPRLAEQGRLKPQHIARRLRIMDEIIRTLVHEKARREAETRA